jgi:PHS family inorganic phosphate transporter-like MFS transporter
MIDLGNFNLRVWAVAASGFFTDSYNLFSTNVILPSLAFVYWTEDVHTWRETVINAMTLLGSIFGMILFGYLADKYGRTRLYGVELVIVVFSTIGVASSSAGFNDMNVLGWLCAWRFVMGVGIGAEYPLSAVITSEFVNDLAIYDTHLADFQMYRWSATRARGRMLGAVFLMQPLGQVMSQIIGLAVLCKYR